ncbi:hypothetical protein [Polyangium mundeleinium]|uniref:Uncharacterized protein n=1 Tax=Polyangium mundeleinium TaxID=2995306 RepID=A0ABT5EMW3_9BACT|nr:hypothetical protein [Polyangium mundeleinium]MDC0743177.1 hypothetical protein [Polyangium mundeleinium]
MQPTDGAKHEHVGHAGSAKATSTQLSNFSAGNGGGSGSVSFPIHTYEG